MEAIVFDIVNRLINLDAIPQANNYLPYPCFFI